MPLRFFSHKFSLAADAIKERLKNRKERKRAKREERRRKKDGKITTLRPAFEGARP